LASEHPRQTGTPERDRPPLSLLVPVANEAGCIGAVLEEAVLCLSPHFALEIVVVDDGSTDDTAARVEATRTSLPQVRLIRHGRRAGKSAALRTAAHVAAGPWIAMLDGDGENDPADLLRMSEGVDVTRVGELGLVAGNRRRRTAGASRLIASRVANAIRRWILKDDCPDTGCGLKLIPRDLFLALPYFDSLHRYIPALVRHLGYEVKNVPVDDRPRLSGRSKYGNFSRAAIGVIDLMGVVWLMRRTTVPDPPLPLRTPQVVRGV
jgi:dolichol-phosphate mannosyltransferase